MTHIRPLTAAAILGLFLSSSALMSGTTTVAAQSAGGTFVSRAVPARQQRLAAFRNEPSVENLRTLLQSNDDDTAIDTVVRLESPERCAVTLPRSVS